MRPGSVSERTREVQADGARIASPMVVGLLTWGCATAARSGIVRGRGGSADGRNMATFTKDMSMMEALQADPRAKDVFAAHGMGCIGCMGVSMESIEDGAKMHGISADMVVAELNKLAPIEEAPNA